MSINRLIPTLMLGANTTGVCWACSANVCLCALIKPVVPITIALRSFTHSCKLAKVNSGLVKSISTSKSSAATARELLILTPSLPTPANSPASAPIKLLLGETIAAPRVNPGAWWTASTSTLPIRPAAPITAIRVMLHLYALPRFSTRNDRLF